MSTLKSVNWALAWRRSIWTVVWAAMMALLVVMCLDLAANQPVIFGIVMLAAFVGSIGLAYTRISWQNGAHATAGAALVVALLAICTHAFMEASYWSSIIDQINQEVSSERAMNDARAAVAAKRKERYVASSNGRSAGQIEAELRAAEQNILYTRSGSCTNATAVDSRAFCQSYFLLQSKLAAAKEAGQLEGVVWSAGTTVEGTAKRNLAAIALLAANLFGGNPETYTAAIVITLVAFTQALLAFALVIGWAPEPRRDLRTAAKAVAAVNTRAVAASPVPAPAPRSELQPRRDVLEIMTGVAAPVTKMVEKTADPAHQSPDPDGPGTPLPAPQEPVEDDRDNVVDHPAKKLLSPEHLTKADLRIDRRVNENSVTRWLRDRTVTLDDSRRGKPAHELLPDYQRYCREKGESALSKRKFSTVLRGELDLPKLRGADGKRKSAVMLFPVELVTQSAKKARAA